MEKKRVLFICQHNSARSQMAEEYLRSLGGDAFIAESAGLEPGVLNPLAIAVMAEDGIDISNKGTQSVFDLFKAGRLYNDVVTVCSPEVESKCPIFPGVTRRYNWPFPDPSSLEGDQEAQMAQAREIRDQIKKAIQDYVDETLKS